MARVLGRKSMLLSHVSPLKAINIEANFAKSIAPLEGDKQ